jgi:hypothetical protein
MIFSNFVSLGPNCVLRGMLDTYLKSKGFKCGPTNFFDYNLCNQETLTHFLKECNLDDYFNLKNLTCEKTNDRHGFAHVWLNNVYFKSIHDVKNCDPPQLEKELNYYIEKYKRRHSRLLDRIKNKSPLLFVYMGEIDKNYYKIIRENLNKLTIKPIPIICIHDFGESNKIETQGLFVKINYNSYCHKIKTKTNWIWMDFIDWDSIFLSLKKTYQFFFKQTL